MAIPLNDGIRVQGGKPAEDKRLNNGVPYTSILEANTLVLKSDRYETLEVSIRIGGLNFIYWWKEGKEDSDLILKQEGGEEGSLPSVMIFKDTVPTYAELTAVTGQQQGHVYGVVNQGKLYVWITDYGNIPGNDIWKDMGVTVDFSNFYNKTEIDSLLNQYVLSTFLTSNYYNKTNIDDNFLSKTKIGWQNIQGNIDFKAGRINVSDDSIPETTVRSGAYYYNGFTLADEASPYFASIRMEDLTNDRSLTIPNKEGKLIVESDLSSYAPVTSLNTKYSIANTDISTPGGAYVHVVVTDIGGVTRRMNLMNFMSDYVTSISLGITLSSYVTTSSLTSQLSPKEDKVNKVTVWSTTPINTNYPSEKLVKDTIDGINTNTTNKLDKVLGFPQSVASPVTFNGLITYSATNTASIAGVLVKDASNIIRQAEAVEILGDDGTATKYPSEASLDLAYPTVVSGFELICPNIATANFPNGVIYKKTTVGWRVEKLYLISDV